MNHKAHPRLLTSAMLAVALLGAVPLVGCKVMSIEEERALRERRGGRFDAVSYVDRIWQSKVLPTLNEKAVPLARLMPSVDADLGRAGGEFGRQAGDGSPWAFVVSGEGQVASVDAASPHGSIEVTLADLPTRRILIQTGPVVAGTAIRDALPFVAFNDFSDQLVFAEVGRALTVRSLRPLEPTIGRLRPGQTIRFTGVTNIRDASEPVIVTPVKINGEAVGA